ncbi:MAG TPA: SRPBCC family protein [Ktedonobacteraceae bacterium]|nr:SRPBCC family protein [Ktedonobacteraceae bacterium]
MAQNLAEHHASVTVNAPVHQVYNLFSHFNDFPKFMSFVKEVTYYDDQRSHWVAEVAGQHEWDAENEDWVTDRQIGWHSTGGLKNYGRVLFQPLSPGQTHVDVYINYDPPGGFLGDIGERIGVGKRFEEVLQSDLSNFARMVDMAPANAEDPNWSQYIFHPESAAAKGTTTSRQNATMGGAFVSPEATQGYTAQPVYSQDPDETQLNRPVLDQDINSEPNSIVQPEERQPLTTDGQPYPVHNQPSVPPERDTPGTNYDYPGTGQPAPMNDPYPGYRHAAPSDVTSDNEQMPPPERMPRQDRLIDNQT